MIRYLIWDADGTLFNTYPAIAKAMEIALEELGGRAPFERIDRLCKVSFSHCIATLSEEFGLDAERFNALFYERYGALPAEDQAPFPGAVALCDYVRSLGGDNFVLTHRGRTSLYRLLSTHGIGDYFPDCVAGDDGFPRKPDPAAFNALIERNDLPREQTLAIGDRELDLLAAHRAGVRACFFGSNPHEEEAEFEVVDYVALLNQIGRENEAEL